MLADEILKMYPVSDLDRYDAVSRIVVLVRQNTNAPKRLLRCPACALQLPTSAFNRDPSRPSGYDWKCRDCRSTRARGKGPRSHEA